MATEYTDEQIALMREFNEATAHKPLRVSEVGIYDMSADDYHADPCPEPSLSANVANTIIKRSALHAHAKHPRLGGKRKPPTKDTNRGSIIHKLMLGKGADIVTIEANDYKTHAAQAARDAAYAAGKLPALPKELAACSEAVASFKNQLEKRGIALIGESEKVLIWREQADDGTLVWCRGMLDHVNGGDIWDVKTSGKPLTPKKLARKIEEEGGHIQAIAYMSGLISLRPQLAGRVSYRWIFCEMEPSEPYALSIAHPRGTMRALGTRHWRQAVNVWAQCLRTGEWPGYPMESIGVEANTWSLAEAETDEEGEAA